MLAPPPLLRIRHLSVAFGGIQALRDLNLELPQGAFCAIIGANGSGKTTLFNCISRLQPYYQGQIEWAGRCLQTLAPHQLSQLGIGRTFQHPALFASLTIRQHLWIADECSAPLPGWARHFNLSPARRRRQELDARIDPLLTELGLNAWRDCPVHTLPGVLRKRVDLARALIGQPRLLLLDEPASGLDDAAIDLLASVLTRLHTQGTTLLMIEHRMRLVHAVRAQVRVMQSGQWVTES